MPERVQPGGRVDEQTYDRFREFVRDRHGRVRGNIGRELEIAMKERMNAANGPDTLQRIEEELSTIKTAVVESEADGGVAPRTVSSGSHTRTPPGDKPDPNAPRGEKVAYLIDQMPANSEHGQIRREELRHTIDDEYQFGDRTAEEYVDDILDHLDAVEHPVHGRTWIWGEEMKEKARAELRDHAEEKMAEVRE